MVTPERILVRAPNWVGDVVMATPALRALRYAHPGAEIAVEARPHVAGLIAGLSSFDRFIPDRDRGVGEVLARAQRLRRQRFDWALLLPDSPRAALAPFFARVPVRVGYGRDPLRRMLLTRVLDAPSANGGRVAISMIERYLRVTRALGCPDQGDALELRVQSDARARVDGRLARAGVGDDEELLVVTPGASFGAAKLWPAGHFASACDGAAERYGLRAILAPGPGEEGVASGIAASMRSGPVHLTHPVTSLPELVALIDRSRLVLSNDTGPRQIAVALRTPVIAVLGPTDPGHTAHHLERQRVLREPVSCSPCHLKTCPIDHRCMTRLEPDRVVTAMGELL